jgi:hypothetical protein
MLSVPLGVMCAALLGCGGGLFAAKGHTQGNVGEA